MRNCLTIERVAAPIACLLISVNAFAQEDHRITADVGALVSTQGSVDPETQDPGFARPGVGGTAFGVAASAAIRVSDLIDVGGEVSFPARFDTLQMVGGGGGAIEIANRHRDTIVSAIARLHRQRRVADRLQFEVLGGPSVVWESTLQQTAYSLVPGGNVFGPFFPATEVSQTRFGVATGVNAAILLARHLSVVPEARFYWIFREDSSSWTGAQLGLAPVVFRAAIALRMAL
jgi:hypothetical protein